MSNVFDKSWEPAVSVTVSLFAFAFVFVFVTVIVTVSVDPCDMLNNFVSSVKCQVSIVKCQLLMLIIGTC